MLEIFPIELLRMLPACDDYDGGVYFLWKGDELLYIGKSKQICYRLQLHDAARKIPYEYHTCIAVNRGRMIPDRFDLVLDPIEQAYIRHYRPPFNHLHVNCPCVFG
jgi:hypothetical protein